MTSSKQRFLTEDDYINPINIDDKLKGEWSVFRVSNGQKYYLSSIYKEDLRYNISKPIKKSDESILKMTKEFALKVATQNKERYVKIVGIVDDKGCQIIIE